MDALKLQAMELFANLKEADQSEIIRLAAVLASRQ